MKENVYSKIWLKKVKNYYDGVRYIFDKKSMFTSKVNDKFLGELIEFINLLIFGEKQFLWFFIEYYCKGKTILEIVKESGFCRAQVYNIKTNFLKWLENCFID